MSDVSLVRSSPSLKLALRFALREMRSGLSGFYIFLACIALGVAAIGGVNSVANSVTAGISTQGQSILGGDIRFQLNQREVNPDEHKFLESKGRVAVSANMRSMARLADGSDQSLVEVKAVDKAYPLYGSLETAPALDHASLFDEESGVYGAAVAQIFLDRLNLKIGDRVLLGSATFELRSVIVNEPDLLSDGFGFAPRFMVSLDGLEAAGLVQPGSLVDHTYKIALPAGTNETDIVALRDEAQKQFPQAGWTIRSRSNAAPSLSANIERFSQFLTLVGLTSLIVGGVGVANAVRAYLDGKRGVIATFKSLGAPGWFVIAVYLMQIVIIALLGIFIGLVLAAIIPYVAGYALQGVLPIASKGGFFPGALLAAAVFGLLTTLAFAILPLGRARDVPATALFREQGFEQKGWPKPVYIVAAVIPIAVLCLLAVVFAYDRRIAMIFVAAVAFSFVVLRAVSVLVQWLARRSPRVRSTALRLAIGNIHRPGALTPSVVLSLGLGLTLLVTLALIDGSLRQQLAGNLPERAPNFFFVDIQNRDVDQFTALLQGTSPNGKIVSAPMLRGRIVAFNGTDITKLVIPPEGAWVLRGDRGITYARNVPENSTLTKGTWWPADYSGEPLVSFSAEEAENLGLKIGDTVTVNVLGRNVTARIANFRQLQWESLAINFVMVFSPNTFAGAPHAWLATLTDPTASSQQEALVMREVTRSFPAVTTVRVKDAITIANELVGQLAVAIRAAASVALIASILVLGGALAAGNRARIHDAVVLKTLGATRRTLIKAFTLEYMLLGLSTAIFALLAGSAAAWYVVVRVMTLSASFQPQVAVMTLIVALVLTVGFGLAGTWRILGQKSAPILRNL
ncbi:ABC transporter permease [Phyllobacterium endophyticum]|uniref:Glycosyl transferase family 1 n=1 Tax=Phyllobacterium endophyticum TaxID=1149773 RepID=A0A2P7AZ29_9HYPH|nr:ABC transporter permease [Phyllobacterium endophyticum]MBB3235955.1 putative ABC transport system permease protein [Phyllobacterium endophyticum]PSH59466.1 glycosyl transferase family 1 [Phyllobacterium endophyticum]TYR41602.1 ABC transporter permease [Phyllobacterium endophyticum]